jgi:hypothetical protein
MPQSVADCTPGTYTGYSLVWTGFAPGTGGVVTTPALNAAWAYGRSPRASDPRSVKVTAMSWT